MKNEQKKSDDHSRIYIIIIAVVLCAVAYCSVRGCGSDDGTDLLYKSTDNTMAELEGEYQQAASELDVVGGQLNSAGATAGRIDDLINRSQRAGTAVTEGITECQRIVRKCQEIVADSNRIIGEVEAANRAGTESGSGS